MLVNYKQNLFATCATMNEALMQANDLYGKAVSSADSIAMRTAVYVVLNSAIQQHVYEMTAAQDKHAAEVKALNATLEASRKIISDLSERVGPDSLEGLSELIARQVRMEVARKMREWIDGEMESRIEKWMDDNLSERVDNTFADKFDDAVNSWADDRLENKMDKWYADNVDVTDDVKKVIEDDIDLDDLVQEKVIAFFGNQVFSIEPR